MTLMKVDQSLFPSFSNLWEDCLCKDISNVPSWKMSTNVPAVNIVEKPNKFLVHLAVPGMKQEDFKINVDNGVLSVASEKKEEQEERDKENKFTRREFYYQSFKRSFTLPDSIEADRIEATYQNGILEISLPKYETSRVKPIKQISVK